AGEPANNEDRFNY
nr:RecName: Full=13 kDa protein [Triakis scyllium]